MSRKYPTWIKQQIEKIATHLITKSSVDDVISVVKQAFEDLDYGRFEAKDIKFTEQLDKVLTNIQMIKTLESKC